MQEKEEISFEEIRSFFNNLVNFFVIKKRYFIAISLIGAIFGLLFAVLEKPIYKAEVSFTLEEEKGGMNGGLGGALGLASQFGFDLGNSAGGVFSNSNIIELMSSDFIIKKSLLSQIESQKITLADYYINNFGLKEKWKEYPIYQNLNFNNYQLEKNKSRYKDSILSIICDKVKENNLYIEKKDKKNTMINITVNSTDENFSKYFCDNLINETSSFYIEIKSKKAQKNYEILLKQTDSIRNELENSIKGVAQADDNVYNLNPALNIKRFNSSRRQIDVQANSTILSQLVANLELAKVTLRKETPLVQIIDRPSFPLKVKKRSKIISILLGITIVNIISIIFYSLKNKIKKHA